MGLELGYYRNPVSGTRGWIWGIPVQPPPLLSAPLCLWGFFLLWVQGLCMVDGITRQQEPHTQFHQLLSPAPEKGWVTWRRHRVFLSLVGPCGFCT
jgi:hypothetical protein